MSYAPASVAGKKRSLLGDHHMPCRADQSRSSQTAERAYLGVGEPFDHTGPMTATVADNALLLEVLAGPDGLDPRQQGVAADDYSAALGQGAAGLRIALVPEGFGHPNSEPEVDAKVRQAADAFSLGATVDEVGVPLHSMGQAIWLPIAAEGATAQMMLGNGYGFNWKGLYVTSLLDFHAGWRDRADELSDSLKLTMLLGHHMIRNYRGYYYAKAQNLARQLGAAYDRVLADYDLLLMPTLPIKATRLPDDNAPVGEIVARALEMISITSPFDVTGHPAMSLPCGKVDGLPVGVMLIGRHYAEKTIYRAAAAYEQEVDWQSQ
jgi:amidase